MKKRILSLIKGLYRGGAEQLLLNAAPYHDTSRFDYAVAYLLPSKNELVPDLEATGMPVYCLDGEGNPGWVWRLRQLVQRERIDLVHTHSAYAAIGARLALGPRPPRLVYTEHGVWEAHHRATYWANLLTFHRSDYVFAVSHHVRESIRYPDRLRFLRMPPVETLYHGIDFSALDAWSSSDGVRQEFGVDASAPVIGSVSNFEPMKGQEYLLEAIVRLRQHVPGLRAILVGRGRFASQMAERARRMGLSDSVVFTGYRPDAPRIAGAFDVFVLPSVKEGLSIALVEAMAQGKPSVVTDAGGLPEVVRHGVEALIVPARDSAALAGAIRTLIDDPTLRERMGAAARRRARRFDIQRAVNRTEEVYEELLS